MGVIENLKDAADLAKKVGDIELYRKIVHLEGEVMELTRQKRQADEKIEELEDSLRFKEEIEFRAPFYFQRQGDQTPYCARCWEKDTRAIHLLFNFDNEEGTRWDCPACKQMYFINKRDVRRQGQITPRVGPWS